MKTICMYKFEHVIWEFFFFFLSFVILVMAIFFFFIFSCHHDQCSLEQEIQSHWHSYG